jgi:predicted ArsR family transcriptional regulator
VDREQRLTAVLADGTRYRIYRWVVSDPGHEVSVADTATEFGLHPNVARMHLGKLEQAGLLTTSLRKHKGGGRPAKLYRLSDEVTSFALPPRRFELLADLAVRALDASADRDQTIGICRQAGAEAGRQFAAQHPERLDVEPAALGSTIAEIAEQHGMLPSVHWTQDELAIDVRNCVFKEISQGRPELVCAMHRAFFEGVVEAVAGDGSGLDTSKLAISRGDDRCELRVHFA